MEENDNYLLFCMQCCIILRWSLRIYHFRVMLPCIQNNRVFPISTKIDRMPEPYDIVFLDEFRKKNDREGQFTYETPNVVLLRYSYDLSGNTIKGT